MPVVDMMPVGAARPKACEAWSKSPSSCAALHLRDSGTRVDPDAAHRREVDDEAVVAGAQARAVVPAAADGQLDVLLRAEPDRGHHVGHVVAAGDQRGAAIDHAVVDGAGDVVVAVAGPQQRAAQDGLEVFGLREPGTVCACAIVFLLVGRVPSRP